MATWHQNRALAQGGKLYHDTQWTVVEDPPNDTRTLSRFETQAEAEAYLGKLKSKCNAKHAYILRPVSAGMRSKV